MNSVDMTAEARRKARTHSERDYTTDSCPPEGNDGENRTLGRDLIQRIGQAWSGAQNQR